MNINEHADYFNAINFLSNNIFIIIYNININIQSKSTFILYYLNYLYIYIYIYIYIVEERLDGHGLLLLRVSRVMRSSDNWGDQLSDDRITRETLSNNNPCPSSLSSTILRSAYMALNTLQQDWLL